MKCEISDECEQTATMWVKVPVEYQYGSSHRSVSAATVAPRPIVSCDDCGPQLGYAILAPLEPASTL